MSLKRMWETGLQMDRRSPEMQTMAEEITHAARLRAMTRIIRSAGNDSYGTDAVRTFFSSSHFVVQEMEWIRLRVPVRRTIMTA